MTGKREDPPTTFVVAVWLGMLAAALGLAALIQAG
jgi:hypothetical protein